MNLHSILVKSILAGSSSLQKRLIYLHSILVKSILVIKDEKVMKYANLHSILVKSIHVKINYVLDAD